jgi:hypothetical protein
LAQVELLDKEYGKALPPKEDLITYKNLAKRWGRPENYLHAALNRFCGARKLKTHEKKRSTATKGPKNIYKRGA